MLRRHWAREMVGEGRVRTGRERALLVWLIGEGERRGVVGRGGVL